MYSTLLTRVTDKTDLISILVGSLLLLPGDLGVFKITYCGILLIFECFYLSKQKLLKGKKGKCLDKISDESTNY